MGSASLSFNDSRGHSGKRQRDWFSSADDHAGVEGQISKTAVPGPLGINRQSTLGGPMQPYCKGGLFSFPAFSFKVGPQPKNFTAASVLVKSFYHFLSKCYERQSQGDILHRGSNLSTHYPNQRFFFGARFSDYERAIVCH